MLNLAASHAWGMIRSVIFNKGSKIEGEDRISALPDDLLIRILCHLPTTKDAVATMFLSKRWRFVWTMVPDLVYIDNTDDDEMAVPGLLDRLFGKIDDDRKKPLSIWRFLDESLQLHKAEELEYVNIQLAQHCPIDVDLGKVITNVINRKVHELKFTLSWSSSKPITLPKCFYTCDSLAYLNLTDKILVDVPSLGACFPSLKGLGLHYVMYKDDESIVKLLSSCPILKDLAVDRHQEDNVTNFIIRVPSLECLLYEYVDNDNEYHYGTLVIDSSALKKIFITDYSGNSCSIVHEDKPCFDKAKINIHTDLDYKFITSFESLRYLELFMNFATVAFCNDVNFSKLVECRITLIADELDWLEPFMRLLQNSPNLKTIFIDQSMIIVYEEEEFTLPSSVPICLSNNLEIFEWKGYKGRSKEIDMVRYIFANSKCLKRAGISMKLSSTRRRNHREDQRKYWMMKELNSLPRVSITSQLVFFTQLEFMNIPDEIMSV